VEFMVNTIKYGKIISDAWTEETTKPSTPICDGIGMGRLPMVATAMAGLFGGTGDPWRAKPPKCDPNHWNRSPFCPRAPRWPATFRLTMPIAAICWGAAHEKAQKYAMRFRRLHVSLLAASAVVTVAAILWFSWQ